VINIKIYDTFYEIFLKQMLNIHYNLTNHVTGAILIVHIS